MSSLSDDEDDHLFSKLELDQLEARGDDSCRDVQIDKEDAEVVLIAGNSNANKPEAGTLPRGTSVVKSASGKCVNEAEDWNDFVRWFETQQIFDTPWFQSIPVTRMNFTHCKSVLVSCRDWGHLDQLANLILAFFKEGKDAGDETSSMNALHLFEILLTRMEDELKDNVSINQRDGFTKVFEELLQVYISGYSLIQPTSIPSLLVKLYPNALDRILIETVQKIMQSLNSDELYSKVGVYENDPDFQNYTNPKQDLASSLLTLLKQKLGVGYFRILPTKLQPIFCFEDVVCSHESRRSSDLVINEVLDILNALFRHYFYMNWENLEFLRFMLRLLPFTWSVLSSKKIMKNVRFQKQPYLYSYIRDRNT